MYIKLYGYLAQKACNYILNIDEVEEKDEWGGKVNVC